MQRRCAVPRGGSIDEVVLGSPMSAAEPVACTATRRPLCRNGARKPVDYSCVGTRDPRTEAGHGTATTAATASTVFSNHPRSASPGPPGRRPTSASVSTSLSSADGTHRFQRRQPLSCRPSNTCAMRNWPRFRRPSAATTNRLAVMFLVLLACVGIQPAAAVSVAFENCLSDNYLNNNPVLLQWVPLYVDASFDTQNASHNLVVTMYGNVTGSLSSAPLPAWNDTAAWNDSSQTDGKILREPDPTSAAPKLTTLHSKIDVLTYEPWNADTDFCANSLTNASCPLSPVFNTSFVPYYNLPSVTMSNKFYSSYAFSSFSATFIIRYGDDAATTIGCVSATVTPSLGNLTWLMTFLPLLVLLSVGFATIFAGIYSPWGTTDIFHWSSNYGRDPDLLRLVTPGFGDCLQYLQFVVLTGGLTLSYPGFYQPIVSQASWSTLMFNQSFVSNDPGTQSVIDGVYYTNGQYGLQNLAQLVGMGSVEDVWAGMMVWLLVTIAAVTVLFQIGFGVQWVYRFARRIPEEDLRAKNWPFSVGNLIRIVFNYFLLPVVALSTFQFVVAPMSPAYTVALAAVALVLIIGFAGWLLYLIISTKPRAVLFDDLPTLLLYGPLYNTYSDEAAAYALTPLMLTLVRGIAIGAVQPAGIAQIVLLAICEVIQILTLHAFLPFHRQSSMNAYHTLFAALRFVTIMLMIAFIPGLNVTEGSKGWIGYVILVIHAGVLILGFFLNAVQTVLEVIARMAGAGGDDVTGQTRGGLSKIFGMRQLSRRMPRRGTGAVSRQSQLSSSAMLDSEEASKAGYIMPGGRLRSESAGSIGVLMAGKTGQRSSSALDNFSVDGATAAPGRNLDSVAGSFTPTTTGGEMSSFSFLPSPNPNRLSGGATAGGILAANAVPQEAADPYYRQPRRARRPTVNNRDRDSLPSPAERTRGSWASGDWSQGALSPVGGLPAAGSGGGAVVPGAAVGAGAGAAAGAAAAAAAAAARSGATAGDVADLEGQRGATPAPYAQPGVNFSPRTDYSTREVDFYYGVRGQRLNSEAPSRRLGTGPADPTGPMASAAGWFRNFLGGKSKEKGKGFEVVRSSRMPPAMVARGGDFDDEGPPPGVPVAMDVIRNGPIESDDEDDNQANKRRSKHNRNRVSEESNPGEAELLDEDGNPGDDSEAADEPVSRVSDVPPMLPSIDAGESIHMPSRLPSRNVSRASRYGAGAGNNGVGDGGVAPTMPGIPTLSGAPGVPRKSSKRLSLPPPPEEERPATAATATSGHQFQNQQYLTPADAAGGADGGGVSRLPFESNNSPRLSDGSSNAVTVDINDGSSHGGNEENIGYVQHGSISRIDPGQQQDLLGSSAEVVDEHEHQHH